ncbi:TIGR02285 family protein [Roseateles sp. P5_E7]
MFQGLVALPLALAACGAQAAGKPVLTWVVLDLPPGSMPVNGRLTDGINDTALKLVFEEMPDWEHKVTVANTARAMLMLSEGAQACFGSALHTPERERIAYFTLAYLLPPLQLLARADTVERLPRNEQGEVLPAVLFDRPDLRGLVIPQRSYSATLDALLNRRSADSGIRAVLATEGGINLIKMLRLGRADYLIEYDFVLTLLQSRNPGVKQGVPLQALPLAGTAPIQVGVACPHTEWGRKAIIAIDAAIAKASSRPDYRNAVNRWLAPEVAKRYQKQQTEFFQRRARPADPGKYPVWPGSR